MIAKTETVLELLSNGADVNARDDMGNTPLYEATSREALDETTGWWNFAETADAIRRYGGVV